MKVQKATRWTVLILLTVTLLTLLTPLAFTNVWLRNAFYQLTVVFSFVVARQLKQRLLKVAIAWLSLICFLVLLFSAFAFSYANRISDDWRTGWISHRQMKHKDIYIGEQMLDVGALGYARRTVKLVPVTSLFMWVTKADTNRLNNDWIRVNEDYNRYSLKY
jgi:hypothetical protein